MLFIRTLYGFIIGLTLPIGIIIITEITPKHIRGRALVIIQGTIILGKIYLLLLSLIFLDDLESGNWRALAIC
jgi:MFS family permease